MLSRARTIWANAPPVDADRLVVLLAVVLGDLARQGRARMEGGDVDREALAKELGNVLLSVVRWCDDLDLDPAGCVERAIKAQQVYVHRRW